MNCIEYDSTDDCLFGRHLADFNSLFYDYFLQKSDKMVVFEWQLCGETKLLLGK